MKALSVRPIQTGIFHAHDNLADFVVKAIASEHVREKMILAVTSKIVSLAEGRLVSSKLKDKATLVREEADVFLGEVAYGCFLTIKEGLLIPSAGIDESNSESGDFILYPKEPYASAQHLWQSLRQTWGLKELGIIFTDSHTMPLRRGVTGICLSYWGFRGVKNLIGTSDLFGRELKMTQMNLADGLAATSVMVMGEGRESQPLALIENAEVEFSEDLIGGELSMPLTEDLYYPMLRSCMDGKL